MPSYGDGSDTKQASNLLYGCTLQLVQHDYGAPPRRQVESARRRQVGRSDATRNRAMTAIERRRRVGEQLGTQR